MSDSIWSDGGRIQMPQYEKLTRIKKVDVTIVGGGLCGLLCAYFAAWPYIQQIAGNFGGREGPHVL